VFLIAGVAAGALAGAAGAENGQPAPSSSAVSQYAELVPTGKGPTAPGLQQEQAASLSPTARTALGGIPPATASALAKIATSSSYGAPKATHAAVTAPGDSLPGDEPSLDRAFQAVTTAASPVGDAYMLGLLLALLFVTAGGAAVAIRARGA
jgi:hypothetical protein